MNSESKIDESLREAGHNLTARLALRTIVFDRPRLFPPSWNEARWENFASRHKTIIEATQKLIMIESATSDQ